MKKSRHAEMRRVTNARATAVAAPLPKSSRKRWIRYAVYALAVLAAVGVRFWLQGPEIPSPALEGLDPALAEEIQNAHAAIWEAPRAPKPWAELGMLLAAHSHTGEAVECFEKAEALDPESWQWTYLRAIAQEQGDPAAALDALRESAVMAGDEEPLPRQLLVERLLETGELDEAQRHLNIALRHWPDHPRANLNQARLLFERDDAQGARAALGKATNDRHTRRLAHQLLAQVDRRSDNETGSAAALAQVKRFPPDEPWPDPWREELESFGASRGAYIVRINELSRRGNSAKLNRTVAASIARYPELGRLVAGRERLSRGDARGAEAALREAVRLDPRWVDALLSLGEALSMQQRHNEAEGAFRQAVKAEPANGEAQLRLGRCLSEQRQYKASLIPLRSAVQYMPTSAAAHEALADALSAEGKLDEADEHRRQADLLSASQSKPPTVR